MPAVDGSPDCGTKGLHPLLPLFLTFVSDITKGSIISKPVAIDASALRAYGGGGEAVAWEGRPSGAPRSRGALHGTERTDSELLARIGMATFHEIIMTLSTALSSGGLEESLALEDGTLIKKHYLWGQLAEMLSHLMEFSLSTDFGSVPRDAGNLTDDEDDDEDEEEEEEGSDEDDKHDGNEDCGKKDRTPVQNGTRDDVAEGGLCDLTHNESEDKAVSDNAGVGNNTRSNKTAKATESPCFRVAPSHPAENSSGKPSRESRGIEVLPNLGFVMTQLVLTLKLVDQIRVLLDLHARAQSNLLTGESTRVLLHSLRDAAVHARTFNSNLSLRTALWRCGFMELPLTKLVDEIGRTMYGTQGSGGRPLRLLPHLFEQEAAANRHLLSILFKMYTGNDADVCGKDDDEDGDPLKDRDGCAELNLLPKRKPGRLILGALDAI